jgi:hypothetical protein
MLSLSLEVRVIHLYPAPSSLSSFDGEEIVIFDVSNLGVSIGSVTSVTFFRLYRLRTEECSSVDLNILSVLEAGFHFLTIEPSFSRLSSWLKVSVLAKASIGSLTTERRNPFCE